MTELLTPERALDEFGTWDESFAADHLDSLASQTGMWREFLVDGGEAALFKGVGVEHMTSSAFIFSPDFSQILLTYHRRLHRWVQMGGHVDREDPSIVAAGARGD